MTNSVEKNSGYNKNEYHIIADYDARISEGISLEERQKREVDFAVGKTATELTPESTVLDIACGSGGHALYMAAQTGAQIDARDISENLIELAQKESGNLPVDFQVGDMGDIKAAVPEGKHYDLISILGGSFAFLHRKEKYFQALTQYLDLLKDKGKIAIQLRTSHPSLPDSLKQIGIEPELAAEGIQSSLSKIASFVRTRLGFQKLNNEKQKDDDFEQYEEQRFVDGKMRACYVTKNKKKEDYYFNTLLEPEVYDPSLQAVRDEKTGIMTDVINEKGESVVVKRDKDGSALGYLDSEGLFVHCFKRVYVNPNGEETDLGANNFDNFLHNGDTMLLLKSLLEEAGFRNVQIHASQISPGRNSYQVVLVGEK